MKHGLATLALLISASAFAQIRAAQSKDEFCQNRSQPEYFQQVQLENGNKLAFVNPPGRYRTGLCWWHSMFQRNATYLTVYDPQKPKPTSEEADAIIQNLVHSSGVVVVPGFNNFYDFSSVYRNEIVTALENWQVAHTMGLGWLKGAMGNSEVSASELSQKMDELYQDVVQDKKVVFQVLQLEGITAHAWLVVGMTRTANGYQLFVQDSNFLSTQVYNYSVGMTSFRYYNYGKFVPYTYYNSDLNSLSRLQKKFCKESSNN